MKKSSSKRLMSLLIAFAMVATIVLPFNTVKAKAAEAAKTFDIIEISDFHGALEDASLKPVAAVLAQNIKDIKKSNPDRTLIIGGGDLYQGTAVSNVFKGVPVQKIMDNIGLEVTTVGNHEFDWTIDSLKNDTLKNAKYATVCSNLYDKRTGKTVFDPYKIIEKDGVKIAVIGAITTETPTIVVADNVVNFDFKEPADEINKAAKEIRDNKKADVVLAVVHEGATPDGSGKASGPLMDIANKLQGVDALLGGHSHTIVNTKVNNMPVVIPGSSGNGFIRMKMTINNNIPEFTSEYVALDTDKANGYKAATPAVDSEVKALVAQANTDLGPKFDEVLGTTSVALTRTQKDAPYGESYLGNWGCDVIQKKVGADVGIQNNGGLRIDVPAGNITVKTIYTLMPFDNTICIFEMTKSQLKTLLEQAFNDADPANKIGKGKGIQISGIKVTYDSSRPSFDRIVSITRENGDPISDTTTLKIATNNFLAGGGDGFTEFKKYTYKNTNILVRDVLMDAVRADKGIVTSGSGRIVNKSKLIQIIGTSDLHGNIFAIDYATGKSADVGLAKISTYVKSVKDTNPNIMLVDSGDTIQGTPLSYYYDKIDTKSEYPMMKVMGAMKYDTWTLGNHEFNYGLDTLNRIIKDANAEGINVLSANIYKTDGTNFVKPYIIKTFNLNGKTQKIAILGLTTKTIPNWENESNYKGLKFNDLVEEAKKWVPIIKAEGADVIVATIHSGEESATDTIPENQIKAIATGVSGIDAIICGHSHKAIASDAFKNPEGKTVLVTQPKNLGSYVSQVNISVDSEGKVALITTENVLMDYHYGEDPAITAIAKSYQDMTTQYINNILGKSSGEFSGKDQTLMPTALMDLVNKVQMDGAKAQLSIAAPLSAAAYIPKGDIRIKDIMSVYVYENFLYGIKMNGKQIKDWMEWSARYYKQVTSASDKIEKDPVLNIPDYNLDMLYGATYDIDLTQPAGQRIKNLKFNGKAIKDTDVFVVAINNYRFNGGGGFMAAAGLKPGDTSNVTYDSAKALGDDGQVRSMMIEYVKKHGTITPVCSNNWKVYTTTVANKPDVKTIKVVAPKGLRIRAAANANSKILGVYKNGTEITVEGESGNWYKVKYNGTEGYIYKGYTK